MPILEKEPDLYPERLLESDTSTEPGANWAAVYTMSRREKEFSRKLHSREVSFYCPIVANRAKSPSGRVRTSYLPLFSNYVFVYATPSQRLQALETNCVSRWLDVPDGDGLKRDLLRIRNLILTGVPLKLEPRLEAGTLVRVRSGSLEGQQGTVIRHQGTTRLIVSVNFLQQGASVLIDDADVEPVR